MGADTFWNRANGATAKEAFAAAVAEAKYESGHGGYSGTIAEKRSFVMITVPEGTDPSDYANKLIEEADPRVDDKWGPAGCISLGEGKYLFFGWASS